MLSSVPTTAGFRIAASELDLTAEDAWRYSVLAP